MTHCKTDSTGPNGIWNFSDSKRLKKLGHVLQNTLHGTLAEPLCLILMGIVGRHATRLCQDYNKQNGVTTDRKTWAIKGFG